MRQCFGITRNLTRCNRVGNWKLFCLEHQRQPLVWLSFIIFTVAAGIASIYSALHPVTNTTKSAVSQLQQVIHPNTYSSTQIPELSKPLSPSRSFQQKTKSKDKQDISKDRPYFALLKTELKTKPPSSINFRIRNTGNRVADNLSNRLIIVDQQFQKEPFISDWSTVNEVPPNTGKIYLEEIQIPSLAVPAYVIFAITYKDKASPEQQQFSQVWYLKWAGTENGILSLDFGDASITEREQIISTLGEKLKGYLAKGDFGAGH